MNQARAHTTTNVKDTVDDPTSCTARAQVLVRTNALFAGLDAQTTTTEMESWLLYNVSGQNGNVGSRAVTAVHLGD